MAELKKKKNRLGTPPSRTDTLNTLAEPEVAPSAQQPIKKVDGRSLRKTGMTEQFNTRVSKEFLKKLRKMAKAKGVTQGKLIEMGLDALDKNV